MASYSLLITEKHEQNDTANRRKSKDVLCAGHAQIVVSDEKHPVLHRWYAQKSEMPNVAKE